MSITKKLRFEVFKRDGFKCAYCGKNPPQVTLEVDHIDPKSKGGKDDINNLVSACFDCNRGKKAIPRPLSEWVAKIYYPKVPFFLVGVLVKQNFETETETEDQADPPARPDRLGADDADVGEGGRMIVFDKRG